MIVIITIIIIITITITIITIIIISSSNTLRCYAKPICCRPLNEFQPQSCHIA